MPLGRSVGTTSTMRRNGYCLTSEISDLSSAMICVISDGVCKCGDDIGAHCVDFQLIKPMGECSKVGEFLVRLPGDIWSRVDW